jgi:flagellar motor switch protein FliG
MSQPLSVVSASQTPTSHLAQVLPHAAGGASRAAIALVALGAEQAAEVLKHLPTDQAELLSAEMAKLGPLDDATVSAVCDDLVAEAVAEGPRGGITYTRDVLVRVVGEERADELIEQFMGGERKPFEFLRSMSAEEIGVLLEGESPQTIALVTVNVKPSVSGRVLDLLEPRLQADVANRIATITLPEPRLLQDIDRGLRLKAQSAPRSERGDEAPSGVDLLAQILQGAGRATERQVLGGLELVDAELAEAVRAKMFTFEDVPKLSDKDLQLVLRDIDAKDLVLALRGAPDELMDRVVANMSQRAGETLREELEMQGPVRRAVVEDAQTQVVAAIRSLDEAGVIELPGGAVADGESTEEML